MTDATPTPDRSSRSPRYGTVDREYGRVLAGTPPEEDGPVWMVNLMKYREVADYAPGADGAAPISGREADDRYTPRDALAAIGARIVFAGEVERQLLGDDVTWDRVAVVRYPTRRSFIDMQARDDFRRDHVHKDAGMDRTFVIGCRPMALPPRRDEARQVDWSDVPHPPTPEDGPVVVVHVIRFEDAARPDATPADMEAYQGHAAVAASEHGVRLAGWFAVEGTIVGDGRGWDQVRFNVFPSLRAFRAVLRDPRRLDAERRHREAAIADTYTMIVRPTRPRDADQDLTLLDP